MQRNPSHFGSYSHSASPPAWFEPDGSAPTGMVADAFASIGAIGDCSGSPAKVVMGPACQECTPQQVGN